MFTIKYKRQRACSRTDRKKFEGDFEVKVEIEPPEEAKAGAVAYEGRAGNRVRTDDLLITNQLLYQLSYAGFVKWR